jgi:hypothetical protein
MLTRGGFKEIPTMMMKMMDMKETNNEEMRHNGMYNMPEMDAFF